MAPHIELQFVALEMGGKAETSSQLIDIRFYIRGHPFMTSKRRGEGVRLRWTHVDGGRGPTPCGRPHKKLKLESTDVILSSSHAKKLRLFFQNFIFGQKKVEI